MTLWKLNFDGGITKNPGGIISYSYILSKNGEIVKKFGYIDKEYEGPTTVNVAEFEGLAHGLRALADEQVKKGDLLLINGDSQFVIAMMNKKWKGNPSKPYWKSFQKCKLRANAFKLFGVRCTFEWVPREQNQECDDLADFALDK